MSGGALTAGEERSVSSLLSAEGMGAKHARESAASEAGAGAIADGDPPGNGADQAVPLLPATAMVAFLPAQQRSAVRRLFSALTQRLASSLADVLEMKERARQEAAVKEFLTTKVGSEGSQWNARSDFVSRIDIPTSEAPSCFMLCQSAWDSIFSVQCCVFLFELACSSSSLPLCPSSGACS